MEIDYKNRMKCGLEIHMQVESANKLFSPCSVHDVHIFDLAYPGSMPSLNAFIIHQARKFTSAIYGSPAEELIFDKKLYFYHDLPAKYQITQYRKPYCMGGHIKLSEDISIPIQSFHIEGDTGSSKNGIVNYQRMNCALFELVTAPVFTDIDTITEFIKTIISVLRVNHISRACLEDGNIRVDVNVSFDGGHRVEIKNLNSLSAIKDGINELFQWHLRGDIKRPITCHYKPHGLEFSRNKESYFYVAETDIPVISLKALARYNMPVYSDHIRLRNLYNFIVKIPFEYMPKLMLLCDKFGDDLIAKYLTINEDLIQQDIPSWKKILLDISLKNLCTQDIRGIKAPYISFSNNQGSQLEAEVKAAVKSMLNKFNEAISGNQNALNSLKGEVIKLVRNKLPEVRVSIILQNFEKLLKNANKAQ
jgi:Asp-tRNA(Asn)/Glu-tRNA(Gln) amidotransferase B subunit